MSAQNFHLHLPSLRELQNTLQADDIMLWILERETSSLRATLSTALPLKNEFSQPLSRGVISQSFLTGLPILEKNLQAHASYDPTFDSKTGQEVSSLMAAPIWFDGELTGILTAVIFTQNTGKKQFTALHLNKLASKARNLLSS